MQSPGAEPSGSSPKLYRAINTRRRGVRHKVHLPAQATLAGKSSGKLNEPSHVLDLSEGGACIQTSAPLAPESTLTLSLDLLETDAFVSASGVVVWSDQRGRNGIRFHEISEASRHHLQGWLLARATSTEPKTSGPNEFTPRPVRTQPSVTQSKREFAKQSPEQTRAALAASGTESTVSVPSDYSSVLNALVAVKREVEGAGNDLDKALQLLAARALSLTRATGAAIALTEDNFERDEMVCRARAGSDAPGLGARLQVGFGFSGECVRSGKTLRCDDAETDPRVDREGCHLLGIRSIIASPIRRDDAAIGLIEVFSPHRHSFGPGEEKILERLAEMIAATMGRGKPQQTTPAMSHEPEAVEPVQMADPRLAQLEIPAQIGRLLEPTSSPLRRVLPAVMGTVLVAGLLWLVVSGTTGRNPSNSGEPRSPSKQNSGKIQLGAVSRATDFESLRKLAVDGDPDAQFDLGARYATGEGVKQDYAESVRWFTLAADQGHVIAQATLGAYYWAGRGIPQDLGKAYFWSAVADAGGDQASKYRLAVLASRMPHNQVAAAQEQANDWLKNHQLPEKTSD